MVFPVSSINPSYHRGTDFLVKNHQNGGFHMKIARNGGFQPPLMTSVQGLNQNLIYFPFTLYMGYRCLDFKGFVWLLSIIKNLHEVYHKADISRPDSAFKATNRDFHFLWPSCIPCLLSICDCSPQTLNRTV